MCQKVKALLLKHAPTLQPDDLQVTSSGATGEDIKMSPRARNIYPFKTECKNQQTISIWKALKQAEEHDGPYTPIVCFSRNREKIYVALEFEDFLKMINIADVTQLVE